MTKLSIDLETYSSVDLINCGLYKYVQSPDFEILLIAYAFDDGPVQQIDLACGEQAHPDIIRAMFDPGVLKKAWNAPFEWYCLAKWLNVPDILSWLPQWHDTAVEAMYCGYPAKLAMAGPAVGLPQDKQKMTVGKALIKYFCVPCEPTQRNGGRRRNLPHHDPEKWELFKTYNQQDVTTERAIGDTVSAFPMPEEEWQNWRIDQEINLRGVRVDHDLIAGAQYCDQQISTELVAEAQRLTGLANPGSTKQLLPWLTAHGLALPNLQKETVAEAVKTVSDPLVRRVLELRQATSKASIAKYQAMVDGACEDDRVRGLTQFYGAQRTGRWSGRFVQTQNLPRKQAKYPDIARAVVKDKDLDMLRFLYPSVPDTLSQLIRTALIPARGHKFVVADFSAIEARVIAWLAGEEWRQRIFAGDGKIYEASAASMFGVPIETIGHDKDGNDLGNYALRAKGKVAELALGYQGSVGAMKNMGADKMGLSDDELLDIVKRWRKASPRIVDLWYAFERAAIDSIQTCRTNVVRYVAFGREIDAQHGRDFMVITLPSGRRLYYDHPVVTLTEDDKEHIVYHGVHQKTHKWGDLETYGGKLTENVVQAIARDCLAITLQRLRGAGFRPVFHVHDEVINEEPESHANALEEACAIMAVPIPWAPGLILRAAGFEAYYYKKD